MVPFYIIATMDHPAVIPKLDEMIGEGLVTTEEVQMLSPAPCPGHDFAVAARVCRPSRGVKNTEYLVYCQRRRDAAAGRI